MALRRWAGRLSIERTLPLLNSALLTAALAASVGVAYYDARRSAMVVALLLIVAGTAAAWAMSRSLTRSLRELKQEVADRTRELREANAELESFSYSVSHDLRAPLRAIDGFAGAMVEDFGAKLDPEARRLLGVIQHNGRRMGQLIDDLLSFSRLNRKELEATALDLSTLARGVVDDLRKQEGGRVIEVAIAPLPAARGDRALVQQMLVNLIGNAFKFTGSRADARVEIGSRRDADETVYYVRDNGVGFDMRYAQKLFGVFQRLHRADEFEGTGMGLALAQRIIHRHGGRVWAEGKVGEGATFYFTLPEGRSTA